MRWQRRDDGVITGHLVDHRLAFLRGEMVSLQRLARRRLDSMPVVMPLGVAVNLVVSGGLPQDERCSVLLAGFMPDEPDWVRLWWEPDLWGHIDACAQLVLDQVLVNDDDQIEIRDADAADAFVTGLRAVAMVAEHRFGQEGQHHWVAGWLRLVADTLTVA